MSMCNTETDIAVVSDVNGNTETDIAVVFDVNVHQRQNVRRRLDDCTTVKTRVRGIMSVLIPQFAVASGNNEKDV